MSAAEFGEWFEMWKWQPWDNIPGPPPEKKEMDALAWAATVN